MEANGVDPVKVKSSQERQSDFETNKAEIMLKLENAEADQKRLNDELTILISIPRKNVTTRLRISIVETQINRTRADYLRRQYVVHDPCSEKTQKSGRRKAVNRRIRPTFLV